MKQSVEIRVTKNTIINFLIFISLILVLIETKIQDSKKSIQQNNSPKKQSIESPYNSYTLSTNNGTDYVINGNFDQTMCNSTYCIFSYDSYDLRSIVGWTPTQDMQIGKSNYYLGSLMPNTKWVVQLISDRPACIYQNFPQLTTGIYQVSYQHALRTNFLFTDGSLLFYYNGFLLDQLFSTDYQLHYRNIQFERSNSNESFQIKFCGRTFNNNTNAGPVLVSVSMKKIAESVFTVIVCSMSNCNLCSINESISTTCNSNYQNKITQCVFFDCPLQYCSICLNSASCLQCVKGYTLQLNSCIQNYSLVANCLKYNPDFTCLLCKSNYILFLNICILQSQNSLYNQIEVLKNPIKSINSANLSNLTNSNNSIHAMNLGNTSNSTNQTIVNNPIFSIPQIISTQSQLQMTLTTTIESSKSLNSIPSVRNYLPFLAAIFLFFDDFWYYLYHHNDMSQLKVIPTFLSITYQINQDRLLPQFMDTSLIDSFVDSSDYKIYQNYCDSKILEIDQQTTYFQHNCRNIFGFQYLFNLAIVFVMYIIFKIRQIYKRPSNKVIEIYTQQTYNFQNNFQPQLDKTSLFDCKNLQFMAVSMIFLLGISSIQKIITFIYQLKIRRSLFLVYLQSLKI